MNDIDNRIKEMKDFFASEEGKRSSLKFVKKLINEEEHKKRWIEKFKNRCESDIDGSLEKLIEKYYSNSYYKREHSIGYEPRESLLWIAFGYAQKYGKKCNNKKYFNSFTEEAYYIGSYVIQVMCGQGSVIRIDKKRK